ncbi:MAG: response regulator [Deferrisomatales bacterium]
MADEVRVLFVDDEENILKALGRLFRREPWDQRYAGSAADALALVDAGWLPHVVVADQRMPGQTGVELLRQVRRRAPGAVRIVLSGYTDVDAILEAVNEGEIYKFLTKPWDDEVLRQVVREAVEGVVLRRENERLQALVAVQNEQLAAVNQSLEAVLREAAGGWGLVEALPVAVVAVGEAGRVSFSNDEARRLLGDQGRLEAPWPGEGSLSGRFAVRGSGPVDAPGWRGRVYVLWER